MSQNPSKEDGADGEKKGDEVGKKFNAQSISIRAQKKLASKLASKKTIKIFIDDTSARVFDNIYKLLKLHTKSRSRAQKVMKNIIKINMKLGVLYLNDCLSDEESRLTMDFREKFLTLAETTVKFHNATYHVDVAPLMNLFVECESILLNIVGRHLTEKSLQKIRDSCVCFGDRLFLEAIFRKDSPYNGLMNLIVNDIQELLDRGII